MPEATMDENDGPVFLQHEVGGSRQRPIVKSESVASPMEETADCQLRAGIPTANFLHDSTS